MEWISICDELPDVGVTVLVCDELNDFVTLGRLNEDEDDFWFDLINIDNVEIDSSVSYWMNLPEPHKE